MNLRERILERIKSRNETLGDVLGRLCPGRKDYPTQFTPDQTLDSFVLGISHGADSECWNWKKTGEPYGTFYVWRAPQKSHKVMFHLWNSLPDGYGIGPGRLVIRHTCNNKKCCNPVHLISGTQLQNLNDRFTSGSKRFLCGTMDSFRRCECGNRFELNNSSRKYCSDACSFTYRSIDSYERSALFIATAKEEFVLSQLNADDFCNKYGFSSGSIRRSCVRIFGKSLVRIWSEKINTKSENL